MFVSLKKNDISFSVSVKTKNFKYNEVKLCLDVS